MPDETDAPLAREPDDPGAPLTPEPDETGVAGSPDETGVAGSPDEPAAPAVPDDPAARFDGTEPGVRDASARDGGTISSEPAEPPTLLDEATLARIAAPGTVRRAPRFGAFIGFGAVLGFVVGVVLAIALDRGDLALAGEGGGVLPFLGGSNGARLMTGVGLAGVGAIVGALLALWADARSRRHAH